MKKTLKNVKDIDDLINTLEQAKKNIASLNDKAMEQLAKDGVALLISKTPEYSGETKAMTGYRKLGEGHYQIYQNAPWIRYLEFGTGYLGASNPHPLASRNGWQYVTGKVITDNAKNGIYGWFFKAKDGNYYFTAGQVASAQVYNTAQELRSMLKGKVAVEIRTRGIFT